MNFVIFDKETGEIVRNISVEDTAEGKFDSLVEACIPGVADENTYVDTQTLEVVAVPPAPTSYHKFNFISKQWEDPRTLQEEKDNLNRSINKWRLLANRSYFSFNGKQIACDALSRSDIDAVNGEISLTNNFPEGFPNAWKAIDNTYVSIPDIATWTQLYKAMTAQGTANFLHAQALKAQVAAATTIAELEAITW